VVTGAGGGIGAAVAARLVRTGHPVALVDRDRLGLDSAAAALSAESTLAAESTVTVECDVADETDVNAAVDAVTRRLGPPTILVTCAAVDGGGLLDDLTRTDWDTTMAVNATSAFLFSRAMLPSFRQAGGSIVTVASIAAVVSASGRLAYSASKGALVAFTKGLAMELAPLGVRANSVCPASVNTPMARAGMFLRGDGDFELGLQRTGAMHPVGHVAEADEIAAVVGFLCSDDASFVTGESIMADGGILAKMPMPVTVDAAAVGVIG